MYYFDFMFSLSYAYNSLALMGNLLYYFYII